MSSVASTTRGRRPDRPRRRFRPGNRPSRPRLNFLLLLLPRGGELNQASRDHRGDVAQDRAELHPHALECLVVVAVAAWARRLCMVAVAQQLGSRAQGRGSKNRRNRSRGGTGRRAG
eukprot:scaffold36079_cov112-Isochrysis_galbana.AAC.2